ncbi:MAG TPA: hypothetical protein VJG31_04510 [Candidatus Nanoarchaeia archaeon]|nr:hypothetical protein [Candidatus Nanoarchaeia archaeon]
MAVRLEEIPLKTEDGINLYHPVVVLFRKLMLERNAKAEKSDLYCPTCKTNLPYNHLAVAPVPDDIDANLYSVHRTAYFCTLCQEYFDK